MVLKERGCLERKSLFWDKCQQAAPVEEELVVDEAVVRAERHDLLVRGGAGQQPQPRPRQLLQHPPQHLVPHPAHVQAKHRGVMPSNIAPNITAPTFRLKMLSGVMPSNISHKCLPKTGRTQRFRTQFQKSMMAINNQSRWIMFWKSIKESFYHSEGTITNK